MKEYDVQKGETDSGWLRELTDDLLGMIQVAADRGTSSHRQALR